MTQIVTKEEYDAASIVVDRLFGRAVEGTDEYDQLQEAIDTIVAYEDVHYPIDHPDPLIMKEYYEEKQ